MRGILQRKEQNIDEMLQECNKMKIFKEMKI